jgi:phosphatidyl-myo-inositol dimannoside synthase
VPYVVVVHGAEMAAGWGRRLAPKVLRRSDGVVAHSQFTAGQAAALGARSDRILQIASGIDETHLRPSSAAVPAEWDLDGCKILLTVSRLDQERKGHDVVLNALPIIARTVPHVRYVIVGGGRLRASLESHAKELGVADRCLFTGRISDEALAALYDRCDVFVMPSRIGQDGAYEGYGVVYLEANAHGVPVIGGTEGGVPSAVVAGETGLLVNPRSKDAVAEAAIVLLTNEEEARRLGENGRRRVIEELSWPRLTNELETFLDAIAL